MTLVFDIGKEKALLFLFSIEIGPKEERIEGIGINIYGAPTLCQVLGDIIMPILLLKKQGNKR